MTVSCGRFVDALWANQERSNAWIWLRGTGWRKLDDRSDDACTDLLALATAAKSNGWAISVHEEERNGSAYITELYDFPNGAVGPTEEISFSVSECVYGWTARYQQRGTLIAVRIRLTFDAGISAQTQANLRNTWKAGIENKWGQRFVCCTRPECVGRCTLGFRVEWVESNEHHAVRVRTGPARSNMTLWDTSDSGDAISHEFGHMLGHPDEYPDAACPTRSPVNTGTVMDDNSEVVERLVRPLCDRQSLDSHSA